MDDLGILKLPPGEHKDREDLCLAQFSPVLINGPFCTARQAAWDLARSPITIAAAREKALKEKADARELELAQKTVAAAEKKQQKAAAKGTALAALSADALAAHKVACAVAKEERAVKSKAKKEASAAAVVAARSLLALH